MCINNSQQMLGYVSYQLNKKISSYFRLKSLVLLVDNKGILIAKGDGFIALLALTPNNVNY